MSWYRAFQRKRLEPAWEYSTNGVIWRLLPSASGCLVGEERDLGNKSTSFFCLERESGFVRWSRREVGEQWWISLDSVHDRTVFLHEYATPSMPDQKKIFAMDLDSGDVRWTNDELRLLFAHEASLYASKDGFEDRQFFELDLANGKVIREVDAGYLASLRETLNSGVEQIAFPLVYDPGTEKNESIGRAIEKIVPTGRQIGLVEYIDTNDSRVFSIYEDTTKTLQSLRQHFAIVGKEKVDVRFADLVAEHAVAPVPDTFFRWYDFVYYIREKRILRAINLSPTDLP